MIIEVVHAGDPFPDGRIAASPCVILTNPQDRRFEVYRDHKDLADFVRRLTNAASQAWGT